MLRASGALDIIVGWLTPLTSAVGLPGDALPMALMRPLSGSGAYGILASIIQDPTIQDHVDPQTQGDLGGPSAEAG